jgi:hypothetical protein
MMYGLLGRDAGSILGGQLHLLGLRLGNFLGRHFDRFSCGDCLVVE